MSLPFIMPSLSKVQLVTAAQICVGNLLILHNVK